MSFKKLKELESQSPLKITEQGIAIQMTINLSVPFESIIKQESVTEEALRTMLKLIENELKRRGVPV